MDTLNKASFAIAYLNQNKKKMLFGMGTIELFRNMQSFQKDNPETFFYEIFECGEWVGVADSSLKIELV